MEALIRVRAVAELLDLRPATVYKLCHLGVLPHLRLTEGEGRPIIRFKLSEIEAWLLARRQGKGCGDE